MSRTAAVLAAVALSAAAAGGVVLPAGPAAAAACSGGTGVTVVVDFHALGGGAQQRCDAAGAGKSAEALFTDNGFPLTYVQRTPGFVCRVSGKPAADPCVDTPPADAYWGLFWSDGTSGTWKYAASGAGALTVPDGGSVAFSWQGSTSSTPPRVAPAGAPAPDPSPSADPTPTRSPSPSARPSTTSAPMAAASVTPSAPPSPSPTAPATKRPPRSGRSAIPSAPDAAASASAATAPASPVASAEQPAAGSSGGDGLPGWAVPGVLLALAVVGGATAYARGRGGDGGP